MPVFTAEPLNVISRSKTREKQNVAKRLQILLLHLLSLKGCSLQSRLHEQTYATKVGDALPVHPHLPLIHMAKHVASDTAPTSVTGILNDWNTLPRSRYPLAQQLALAVLVAPRAQMVLLELLWSAMH